MILDVFLAAPILAATYLERASLRIFLLVTATLGLEYFSAYPFGAASFALIISVFTIRLIFSIFDTAGPASHFAVFIAGTMSFAALLTILRAWQTEVWNITLVWRGSIFGIRVLLAGSLLFALAFTIWYSISLIQYGFRKEKIR